MIPKSINCSNFADDKPIIFTASLDTKCSNLPICFAAQSLFTHLKTTVSSFFSIFTALPHTGQNAGIISLMFFNERVWFSAICGIIILALNTSIVSPIFNFSESIIDKLWTDARETVVPSNSTGSKIATGFSNPVRLALHSILRSTVFAVSSFHLNAIPFLGNLDVEPRLFPYFISS